MNALLKTALIILLTNNISAIRLRDINTAHEDAAERFQSKKDDHDYELTDAHHSAMDNAGASLEESTLFGALVAAEKSRNEAEAAKKLAEAEAER